MFLLLFLLKNIAVCMEFRCCDPEHISRYLLVHLTLYGTFMKRGYMCIALYADDEAFPVQMKSS